MRSVLTAYLATCGLLYGSSLGVASNGGDPRGVRNVGRADGYSVSYIEALQKPGTKLVAGVTTAFSVRVKYTLNVADSGRIILVFQDDHGRPLFPQMKQVAREVGRGSGEVMLAQEVVVPSGVKRLNLFVPIVPNGMTHTSGELLIEYKVESK